MFLKIFAFGENGALRRRYLPVIIGAKLTYLVSVFAFCISSPDEKLPQKSFKTRNLTSS